MRRELRVAEASDSRVDRWRESLEAMRRREVDDATVFDREVFYAVQPRGRLVGLIDRYRAAFAT